MLFDEQIFGIGALIATEIYAQIGTYSENFLDLFSGSAALISLRSSASCISAETIERCFSGILRRSRRDLFVIELPDRCLSTAC